MLYMKAEEGNVVLEVHYDPYPENPRVDLDDDPMVKVIGWHSKYTIGDEHDYQTPADFMQALVHEVAGDKLRKLMEEIWTIQPGKEGWQVLCREDVEGTYDDKPTALREMADMMEDWYDDPFLTLEEFYELVSDEVVIKPVYIYDHSGVALSTRPFNDPWDSGQVGFVYAYKKDLIEHPGYIERAEEMLDNAVEVFSQYLNGEVYGYKLIRVTSCTECGAEQREEIDSCWGFYGDDFDKNGLKDHLPAEYQHLVDKLEIAS